MTSVIDFDALWTRVAALSTSLMHGIDHWRRVEGNGLILAERTGADVEVVRLFAIFHDSRRLHDGTDHGHGARGAELAASWRGVFFDLPDDRFESLRYACVWHTDQTHHSDPTIGSCWDADRLDLGRVGIQPDPRWMSTDYGRELAARAARGALEARNRKKNG